MAQLDDNGWIYIGYGDATYQCIIKCEDWEVQEVDESASFIHYPSDGHFGWSLETKNRVLKLKNVYFSTKANYDLFITNLNALQNSGAFEIRIKVHSDDSWFKWDGTTNYSIPVLFKSMKGIHKPYRGDATIYEIKSIEFEQAGELTT